MFRGQNLSVTPLRDGLIELCFDRSGSAINKLDSLTIDEFHEVTQRIADSPEVRGVLVTSAKDVFIVGADITEFSAMFRQPADVIAKSIRSNNEKVTKFEDLQIPTVMAINGYALGGGLELALLGSLRVIADSAQVGLPEVKLGLIPGLGGTVRLPRVTSLTTAIDWIVTGKSVCAQESFDSGLVDAVVPTERLRARAIDLLERAVRGEVNWQAAQQRKKRRLSVSDGEAEDIVGLARPEVVVRHGKHRPAAAMALELMGKSASCDRTSALDLEAEVFGRVARTQAAASLVQGFLSEQSVKKLTKHHVNAARQVRNAAVVGAGIMGGGIACVSAQNGIPVRMKDVAQSQLDLGINEARRQITKLIRGGVTDAQRADITLALITPQLDNAGFSLVDYAVEAVVEDLDVKRRVIATLEDTVRHDAVIASNTSSLRIDDIADGLRRPENLVGMHFFNPVPMMKLVEVIRGTKTSEATVSTAVGYAVALGKTPIVVSDCPGFLVNRILMAYVNAFLCLLADGGDFENIDRVMESFGWPMGPAALADVIGMDVLSHVADVIRHGYRERMETVECDALKLMVAHGRYGQKAGMGFYRYEPVAAGRPTIHLCPDAHVLIATLQICGPRRFSDNEIVERMMVPMIVEAARALEEGVVTSAAELDTALVHGLGFPPHAGGALKYADWLGLGHLVGLCDKYSYLGKAYEATSRMRAMVKQREQYYPD